MRVNCKFYESRTYSSGEVVQMCRLDLAPDAPWRCPDECPSFARRLHDAGWTVGSLARSVQPPEPELVGSGAAELLDEAERIVHAIGADTVAEVHKERARQREPRKWWHRLPFRRR